MTRELSLDIDDGGLLDFNPDLKKYQKEVLARIRSTNESIARTAVEILTTYPPETAGNFPPPPYWQRGVGMINSNGNVISGQESFKYGNSQDIWKYQTRVMPTQVETRASTDIPYAPYVGDADLQAWFHRDTGWMTDKETVDFIEPQAQEMLNAEIGTLVDLFTGT
jgi:hypothetical protein